MYRISVIPTCELIVSYYPSIITFHITTTNGLTGPLVGTNGVFTAASLNMIAANVHSREILARQTASSFMSHGTRWQEALIIKWRNISSYIVNFVADVNSSIVNFKCLILVQCVSAFDNYWTNIQHMIDMHMTWNIKNV